MCDQIGYWEAFNASQIREVDGSKTGAVNGMMVSPDGQHFVTCGDDKLIKVNKEGILSTVGCHGRVDKSSELKLWCFCLQLLNLFPDERSHEVNGVIPNGYRRTNVGSFTQLNNEPNKGILCSTKIPNRSSLQKGIIEQQYQDPTNQIRKVVLLMCVCGIKFYISKISKGFQ